MVMRPSHKMALSGVTTQNISYVSDKRGYSLDFNSSPPSAASMRRWIGSALFQILACCLFGTKPLSNPTLGYCQFDSYEQTSGKFFIKIQNFSFPKMHLKISSAKWRPFLSRGRWVKAVCRSDSPSKGLYVWFGIHRDYSNSRTCNSSP